MRVALSLGDVTLSSASPNWHRANGCRTIDGRCITVVRRDTILRRRREALARVVLIDHVALGTGRRHENRAHEGRTQTKHAKCFAMMSPMSYRVSTEVTRKSVHT